MIESTDVTECTATSLLELYRRREVSPVEVTEAVLHRIERLNPVLNCFALVAADEALDAARASEGRWQAGEPIGPLDGVPAVDQGPDPHTWVADAAGQPDRRPESAVGRRRSGDGEAARGGGGAAR